MLIKPGMLLIKFLKGILFFYLKKITVYSGLPPMLFWKCQACPQCYFGSVRLAPNVFLQVHCVLLQPFVVSIRYTSHVQFLDSYICFLLLFCR